MSVICVFLCLVLQPSISQDSIYPLHGYEYTTEHSHVRVMFGGQASYPFAQGLSVKIRGETRAADKHRQYDYQISEKIFGDDSHSSTQLPPSPMLSSSKPNQTRQHYFESTTTESPTLSVKHSPRSLFSSRIQTYSLPTSPPNHYSLHGDNPEQLLQHRFYPWSSYPSPNLQTVQNPANITLQKCQNLTKIFNTPITKQRPIQHRIKPIYLVNRTAKSMKNQQPGQITSKNGEIFKSIYISGSSGRTGCGTICCS